MTNRNRKLPIVILCAVLAVVLSSASAAMAAPSFEVELERDPPQVSRSDERIDYTVKVKNLSATATSTAGVGDVIFCAGEHPIRTWGPIADRPENSIQWLRNGELIPGESANFYTAIAVDEGKAIQCLVKGTNGAGASVQASLPPSVIAPVPPALPPAPTSATNAASRPTVTPTSGAATIARTCTPPTNWTGVATATANTSSGSNTLTAVTAAPFAVGQQISGPGIPAHTTIVAVGAGTLEISTNATANGTGVAISAQSAGAGDTTAGSDTIANFTTPAPGSFAVGQQVKAPGFPAGTTVIAVGAGTLQLSASAGATATGISVAATSAGDWAFQWLRNTQPIPGATTHVYQPDAADDSTVLQCRVLATNAGGSVLVNSITTTVGTVSGPPANIAGATPGTIADATTVTLELPGGQETFAHRTYDPSEGDGSSPRNWSCTKSPATPSDPAKATCIASVPVAVGGFYPQIRFGVGIGGDVPDTAVATATVDGSGSPEPAVATDEFTFDPLKEFGVNAFDVKNAGDPAETTDFTQAGGHPLTASARFGFVLKRRLGYGNNSESAKYRSIEELRSVVVDTPRGFVGNALAVPELCPSAEAVITNSCPEGSVVGGIRLDFSGFSLAPKIFALEPEFGKPAQFAFSEPLGNLFTFAPVLRAEDGYAISIVAAPSPQVALSAVRPTLCGYGLKEIDSALKVICKTPSEPDANPLPLVTNPTRCSGPPPVVGLAVDSWTDPGDFKRKEFSTPALENCDKVPFEPSAELVQTNQRADSPTGMNVEISMPTEGLEGKDSEGNLDPDAVSQANLNTATVTFPKGMSINPAASDGLGACSLAQLKFKSNEADQCPASSKVGTVEVDTPLIKETLTGNVYVAKQKDNPFNATLGLYMVFSSPRDGITIKVAGRLVPDPVTGQLTSIFTENPEAPFSRLSLRFNGGPRAPLINPPQCGIYEIHSEFSPWSAVNPANPTAAEIVSQTSEFQVTEGPNGAPCPDGALAPKLRAGLQNPAAGAKSPFVLSLSRADGSGRFTGLELTMPKGLTAYLKGIPYCPDNVLAGISSAEESGRPELTSPACPAASQVGTVQAGAGAGPFPFFAPGRAYLAGPYKGAPLSLAVVTPAVAGPFDLGNVVIRNALYVNPETAQVTAKSDPIPTILHGILLDVRDIRVNLDRPGFTAAPSSCEPMSIDGRISGEAGTAASASYPFQAGGCANLGFKPKLQLQLFGGTKRGAYPRLRATLTTRPGDANIAGASVALPHSAFLAQNHIRTICTRVQFAAKQCPAGSVYGEAEATTPLLDGKVSGPVYLRSSSNPLPDLVAALRGPDNQPIEVVLAGRVDSVNGGIRNSFDVVPDAPVTKFVLNMQGGRKGLLVNSRDICKTVNKATAKFTAHNGRRATLRPKLTSSCKKAGKGKQRKQSPKSRR